MWTRYAGSPYLPPFFFPCWQHPSEVCTVTTVVAWACTRQAVEHLAGLAVPGILFGGFPRFVCGTSALVSCLLCRCAHYLSSVHSLGGHVVCQWLTTPVTTLIPVWTAELHRLFSECRA